MITEKIEKTVMHYAKGKNGWLLQFNDVELVTSGEGIKIPMRDKLYKEVLFEFCDTAGKHRRITIQVDMTTYKCEDVL